MAKEIGAEALGRFFTDGKEYDLVCGQGRLEAYIANNQTEIPAIIIDADEEEMS